MGVYESRTFRSGNSEAVRLPKGVGFGIGTAMRIERDGNRIVLTPVIDEDERRRKFLEGMAALRALPKPSQIERRDAMEFPDRPGL